MSSKLSGYGHTAGESMGGTGANMNQQHGGSSGGGCALGRWFWSWQQWGTA